MSTHRHLRTGLLALSLLAAALPAGAQFRGGRGGGWWRSPPKFAETGDLERSHFTFCRLYYTSVRSEALGHGWNTDYPASDQNFMVRLGQLTHVKVNTLADGEPNHVVVQAMDDHLFGCPFIFMSDVGTAGFTRQEAERLRA